MDNLTWDSPINKTNDFYWYGISLICISIPILLEIFDRYKKEKKNNANINDEMLCFENCTYSASKYEPSKIPNICRASNITFYKDEKLFNDYFYNDSMCLMLFRGNNIGIFLNKSEMELFPGILKCIEKNSISGYVHKIIVKEKQCIVVEIEYISLHKSWMLLKMPFLLNIPYDGDHSMYEDSEYEESNSKLLKNIMRMIDEESCCDDISEYNESDMSHSNESNDMSHSNESNDMSHSNESNDMSRSNESNNPLSFETGPIS